MNHHRFEPTGRRDRFLDALSQMLTGVMAHSPTLQIVPICDCEKGEGGSDAAYEAMRDYAESLAGALSECLREMQVVGVMVQPRETDDEPTDALVH
jgi:hypothetical protein